MKLVSWLFIGLQLLILATALDGARRCFKPPVTPTSTPTPSPTPTPTPAITTDPNDGNQTTSSSSETTPKVATDTTAASDATDSSDVTDTTTTTVRPSEGSTDWHDTSTEPTDSPATDLPITTPNGSDLPNLTTTESPYVDADAMCKYHPGVHYLPHPYNCHKFIQCDEFQRGEIHTCPDNLYWNSEILTCDRTCA